MPDDAKLFLDQDYVTLSMKMVRRIVYRDIEKLNAIFDYQEQWRKLNAEEICVECSAEVQRFMFCIELKKEIDNCSIMNVKEECISSKAKYWYNKLTEDR